MTNKSPKKERRDKRRPLSDFPRNLTGTPHDEPDDWQFLLGGGKVTKTLGDEVATLPLYSGVMGLGGWVAEKYETFQDGRFIVYARCRVVPVTCDRCNGSNLINYGSQTQKFHDVPYHAQPTTIIVERQRLRCKDCGKTQFQMLTHMDSQHMMTERLKFYVREQAMQRTFTSVAEDVGIHDKTVRRIFDAYADELEQTHKVYTPEWLGIDEVHLTSTMRCVLTDVYMRKPLDILIDMKKPTVERWLRKYIDPEQIKVVTIDMHTGYRNAVQEVLPNVKIIVDKWHVDKYANKAMETVRKRTHDNLTDYQRKQLKHDRKIMLKRRYDLDDQQRFILQTWLGNFEDLGKAYLLKEAFFDIYSFQTKYEAEMAYRVWLDDLNQQSDVIRDAFEPLTTAMSNWREWIFNYFDVRTTNAYTESVNSMLKQIYRNGRGYSFKAIRAKVLYGKIDHQR
jgi:transposase